MKDAPRLFDYQTVEYVVEVPAREKQKWTTDGLYHLGTNAGQDRVRLGE